MVFIRRVLFMILPLLVVQLSAQNNSSPSIIWKGDTAWASAKLKSMTLDEKLGQLFMIATYSNKGEAHKQEILKLVKEENIGGLIFFQGGPNRQARLTNIYQQSAKVPLMIAMDAEWGLAMRLDSTFKYPWPITVGATKDTSLAYEMGKRIALDCKRLGVHINFGPVVDINTNPDNPIINARSFGESRENVTQLGNAYMRGMQDVNVLACAKHFPGHGDTDQDSHKTLPTVAHNMSRLDSIELYPYQNLINDGLGSIMAAHLNVPAMDASGKPTSLSAKVVDQYLKKKMGFNGLVFTDALNMRGVSSKYPPGEVDVEALLAGNDVLLFSQNVTVAKTKIKEAIAAGKITEAEINKRVWKILTTKSWLGLEEKKHLDANNLYADLHKQESRILNRKIYAKAITLVKNKGRVLPIKDLKGCKIACVTSGADVGNDFVNTLQYYSKVDHYSFNAKNESSLLQKLSNYDIVIVGIYTSNKNPWKSYKVSPKLKSFIRKASLQNKIVLNLFANPYALKDFSETEFADAVMVSYQNDKDAESLSAQAIFGALPMGGKLPVTASNWFEKDFGLFTQPVKRLGYGLPEEVGMDGEILNKIDLLVKEAMNNRATPGCQVLVARKGKVVFNKSYGYHTYKKKKKVSNLDIYDLASITKMAASVPLLMQLVEQNKVDIDRKLSDYLVQSKGTNKEDLILREIFAHQARLQPWIPFYVETINKEKKKDYYSNNRDFNYPHTVAKNFYSTRHIQDTILKRIFDSKLRPRKEYKYSDLGYYLLQAIMEQEEGEKLENMVQDRFYERLGAYTMTYRPLEKFASQEILPTENDKVFRNQVLTGHVHDQGAAMLGGVAGHAGLFSNANDLAKLMQMYMQYGEYGGDRFFDSVTVKEFTRCQYCKTKNRRGIGFDKKQLEGEGPACDCVSPLSFGHSGFTGTLAWADPETEIVYIFLSNRVYPSAENRKLLSLSTRTRIQEVIYNSIVNEEASTIPITELGP